ncbi:hypothetical protein BJ170DRAFT_728997 [Xylariales sp. AK1849]|nr:hypothetical protein BJ170DRAFT_728997 [Xylariales sp. AK1849]
MTACAFILMNAHLSQAQLFGGLSPSQPSSLHPTVTVSYVMLPNSVKLETTAACQKWSWVNPLYISALLQSLQSATAVTGSQHFFAHRVSALRSSSSVVTRHHNRRNAPQYKVCHMRHSRSNVESDLPLWHAHPHPRPHTHPTTQLRYGRERTPKHLDNESSLACKWRCRAELELERLHRYEREPRRSRPNADAQMAGAETFTRRRKESCAHFPERLIGVAYAKRDEIAGGGGAAAASEQLNGVNDIWRQQRGPGHHQAVEMLREKALNLECSCDLSPFPPPKVEAAAGLAANPIIRSQPSAYRRLLRGCDVEASCDLRQGGPWLPRRCHCNVDHTVDLDSLHSLGIQKARVVSGRGPDTWRSDTACLE